MTNTVTMATPKKVATATIERVDSRASPQTPWPDVQPFARRVPNPTRSPPTMRTGSDPVIGDVRKRAEGNEEDERPEQQAGHEGDPLPELAVDPAEHAIDNAAGDAAHTCDAAVDEKQERRGEADDRSAGEGLEIERPGHG